MMMMMMMVTRMMINVMMVMIKMMAMMMMMMMMMMIIHGDMPTIQCLLTQANVITIENMISEVAFNEHLSNKQYV